MALRPSISMDGCFIRPQGAEASFPRERGAPQIGALKQLLIDEIEKHQIDVVSLDPFIKTHGLEENDNNAIDLVCDLLASIAIDRTARSICRTTPRKRPGSW